ncbi:MAG TPA: hypothetical protein VL633_03605 [Bacteroidota bacterium]|nr:hypothetical protein [Bacteroidota bacterium]
MIRVVTIVCVLLVIQQYCDAQSPVVRGELRYEHQYQDYLPDGGNLSTSLRQGPGINLNILGNILSKRILTYSLFTSLAMNFSSTRSDNMLSTNSQYNWNTYNLIVNLLPYSRTKFDLSARDNVVDIKSKYDITESHGRTRQQEQRIAFSLDEVPELPTTTLSYTRNRSWAPLGEPSEQLSQQYTFGFASSHGTTASVGFSGSLNDITERYTNFHERLLTLNLTGTKQLSERHSLSINSDYNKYTAYSNLRGSIGYSGQVSDRVRLGASVSGLSFSSAYTVGRTGSAAGSVTYGFNEHFQAAFNINGSTGITKVSSLSFARTYLSNEFGSTVALQHNRNLGSLALSNNVTFGYVLQEYIDRYRIFNGAISNGIQLPLGLFSISGDYTFTFSHTRNAEVWNRIGNNAGLIVNGTVLGNVKSNSSLRYRDDHYNGDISSYRNQQNLLLSQSFDGSFYYAIPFNLGVGSTVNWYYASIRGHTHGWHVSFSSPEFFLRGLFASYVYTRTFDPYYTREIAEHNASLRYQWRALMFQARFHYATFPVRVRDFWFSVSRPF